MLPTDRQKQILDYLTLRKSATVQQLCGKVYASAATIRRDLSQMEKRGLVQRTHGGAVIAGEGGGGEESLLLRQERNVPSKNKIAELASYFIKDSSTVFMDPSSTVCRVAPYLKRYKNVTVITNGLNCAMSLSQKTPCHVYIPAGQLTSRSNSVTGSDTLEDLSRFCADTALVSCAGLSLEYGVTEPSVEQSRVKMAMLKNARTKILLIDHTKFGLTFLSRTCTPEIFDYIITDEQPDDAVREFFSEIPCELVFPE